MKWDLKDRLSWVRDMGKHLYELCSLSDEKVGEESMNIHSNMIKGGDA